MTGYGRDGQMQPGTLQIGPFPPDSGSSPFQCALAQASLHGPMSAAGLLAWNQVRNDELSSFHIDPVSSGWSSEMSRISRGSFSMLN